ncbi:hypothetical protein BDV23DRAFT_150038 [Aspergillus alliaceus]|uniref:Uncharacterized protein n=1 Tax=Petromyces alliaceus TaxID=209559 RepID=A0A5N7CHR7_PETAA|nr:hypothetical protein BDV23DRAFT_150038 [Aspergillus alliaceus]
MADVSGAAASTSTSSIISSTPTLSAPSPPQASQPDSATLTGSPPTLLPGSTPSSTPVASSSTSSAQPSTFSSASNSTSASTTSTTGPNRTGTSAPQTSHASSGVSNGALAGAVVGSIVGTAIIAVLVSFLYIRFRKNQDARTAKPSLTPDKPNHQGNLSDKSSHPLVASQERESPGPSATSLSQLLNLSSYVPEPADDSVVCARIQTLFDLASLHVDNYYFPASSPTGPPTQDALARITTYESPFLPAPLVQLLSKRRVRRAALTHVLVRSLLEAIQSGSATESLLPIPYASASRSGQNAVLGYEDSRALFAWRMLTSRLYKEGYFADSVTAEPSAVRTLAASFVQAFAPYSDPDFSETSRLDHLMSVTRAAADLGVWLFAQPCSFDFCWNANLIDKVAVLPAVVKVSDEQGQRLFAPRVLVEETVVPG